MQESAQVAGRLRIGLALFVLEDETPLPPLKLVRRVLPAAVPVSPVPVKMDDVIVARLSAQLVAKLIEGRWS
jgi:hypothetical protein